MVEGMRHVLGSKNGEGMTDTVFGNKNGETYGTYLKSIFPDKSDSSLGRYVFGSEISYNKPPPACLG
jgi:hypothetical protein